MANPAPPTPSSLAAEVYDLRARATRFARLTRSQFNWRPTGGPTWSVGQCFDHLTRANALYLDAVAVAIDRARPRPASQPLTARANLLGRWMIASLEPPATRRLVAPRVIQPAAESEYDVDATLRRFDDTLVRLAAVVPRAWTIDPNRTRFKNPLLSNLPLFNITAALQILTAHGRRHLVQAEQVRARPDWPTS
jgi:hypothetical protein